MAVSRKSPKARLLAYLQSGYDISSSQAATRFGLNVQDVPKRIQELRAEGFPIYSNRAKNTFGESVIRYRLGNAPRNFVALGYRIYGAEGLSAR